MLCRSLFIGRGVIISNGGDGGGGGEDEDGNIDPLTVTEQWFKDNTGAKGTLTESVVTSITTNGALYENKIFTGTLTITANNVTLRNCVINGGDWNGVDASGSDYLTMENCTVIGSESDIYNNAILAGTNATIYRCDVSVHQHAITPQGGADTLIKQCYVHDGYMTGDKHVGGISIKGGEAFTGMLVEQNWVFGQDTSCVFIKNDFGPVANTIVKKNVLRNQPGATNPPAYTVYSTSDGPGGTGQVTGTQFIDNVMESGWGGYFSIYENGNPQPVISGNVDLNGNPISGP